MYRAGLTQGSMQSIMVGADGNQYSPAPTKNIIYNYKRQSLVQVSAKSHDWSGYFIADNAEALAFINSLYAQRVFWFEDNSGAGPASPVQVVWHGEAVATFAHPSEQIVQIQFKLSTVNAD